MKKYPTRQSTNRVSSVSNAPKRSRNDFPDSLVRKVRSEDTAAIGSFMFAQHNNNEGSEIVVFS